MAVINIKQIRKMINQMKKDQITIDYEHDILFTRRFIIKLNAPWKEFLQQKMEIQASTQYRGKENQLPPDPNEVANMINALNQMAQRPSVNAKYTGLLADAKHHKSKLFTAPEYNWYAYLNESMIDMFCENFGMHGYPNGVYITANPLDPVYLYFEMSDDKTGESFITQAVVMPVPPDEYTHEDVKGVVFKETPANNAPTYVAVEDGTDVSM